MGPNERFVRDFLSAIEGDRLVGNEEAWYAPGVVQVEFPNRLNPKGVTRDLAAIKGAGERGRAIVDKQSYEVVGVVESGNRVAVETVFRASFKVDIPGLPKGQVMIAHFAIFLEIEAGQIVRHHTYDCFEPW